MGADHSCMQTPEANVFLPTFKKGEHYTNLLLPLTRTVRTWCDFGNLYTAGNAVIGALCYVLMVGACPSTESP